MKSKNAVIAFIIFCMLQVAFPQSKQLVPTGSGGRRVALVIGNSSYQATNPLKNVENDVGDMRKALRDKGFAVSECCENVGLQALQSAIDDWTSSLKQDDVALFYFSGHGIRVNSTDYLVPVGYPSNSTQADVKYRAYAVDELQEKMQERGTRVNVIILDACRDNPYVFGKGLEKGMAETTIAGRGTYMIYSASPGQVSSINAGGKNSLFTMALLEDLKKPSVSLRNLGPAVKDRVYDLSNGTQTPYISENLVGDVVLGVESSVLTESSRVAANAPAKDQPRTKTPKPSTFEGSTAKERPERPLIKEEAKTETPKPITSSVETRPNEYQRSTAELRSAVPSGRVEGQVSPSWGKSVVYVDTIRGKTFPAALQNAVIDQKDYMFVPRILVVQQGTTVEFQNSDNVQHNVFWPSISGNKKEGHNLGTWAQSQKRWFKFDTPGVVPLLCNLHPEMAGYIIVSPTPYFAETDASGSYKIENVPDGKYNIVAWHEGMKMQTKSVDVAGGGGKADFSLMPPQ